MTKLISLISACLLSTIGHTQAKLSNSLTVNTRDLPQASEFQAKQLSPSIRSILAPESKSPSLGDHGPEAIDQKKPVNQFTAPKISKGGVGDGGGDPRASKVLEYGKRAVAWLLETPHIEFGVDAYEMLSRIKILSLSLDSKEPLLRFQPGDEINCFGASKKGCVYSDGSIDIAGGYWENLSTSILDQCSLALTELIRPQRPGQIYEKAPQICERLNLGQERHSALRSGAINPIPKILGLAVGSLNANYDGTVVGLNLEADPSIPQNITQKLYDSPANGPQNDWVEYIEGMSLYRVLYSETRKSEFVSRPVFFRGSIRITRVHPKTIRFQGQIDGSVGTSEIVKLKNGRFDTIKHGI